MVKILLAHLNSNGDCLYATVIARQIKEVDYPGARLTWAVNTKCKQSLLLNPYVDEIWEVPTKGLLTSNKEWTDFVRTAETRRSDGEFDLIFYTQIIGENIINFDGGIRSSIYNNYPHPITVSQQPVIVLSGNEIENVRLFALKNQLETYDHVVLVECGPDSFASALNPVSSKAFAEKITKDHSNIAFILSSNKKIEDPSPCIIDGSVLSFRENAELTKYCSLFIGCSSGISWLTTTQWAKPLPKIILTNPADYYTSSMVYDHAWAKLPTENIIELHSNNKNILPDLEAVLLQVMNGKFEEAKRKYHQPFRLKNFKFVYHQCKEWVSKGDLISPLRSFQRTTERNGFNIKACWYLVKGYLKMPLYIFQKNPGKNN